MIQWHRCWRKTKTVDLVSRQCTLIVARNVLTDEVKYFLSNRVPSRRGWTLRRILRVAFGRWPVEGCFREAKEELGLDHFECRGWRCIHRHLFTTILSQLFCAQTRQRLSPSEDVVSGQLLTMEQVRRAANVMIETQSLSNRDRTRKLAEEAKRQAYYARRNAAAAKSQRKSRRKRLSELGIDPDKIKSLVSTVRKDTGVFDLPFFCGSSRRKHDPDDISDLEPKRVNGRYPAVEFVLKAQWDARKAIPHARAVILRDIEKHPMNVHYNTTGQLKVGKLFAEAFLQSALKMGDHTPQQILTMLGAKGRDAVTDGQLAIYRRIFGFMDANGDGQHSKQEFVEDGRYLTRKTRQGIFRASDSNCDGIVSVEEYIENRIITDEAKTIFETMDADDDGKLTRKEFIASGKLNDEDLAKTVFEALDSDDDGDLVVPEYLRVWGRWARTRRRAQATGF